MMTQTINLDAFLANYIEAALWCSINEEPKLREGEMLDASYDVEDIDPDTLKAMRADCEKFIQENELELLTWEHPEYSVEQMGGHDFWLTRTGQGSGFWDGDWKAGPAKRLTKSCEMFGETWLYVGDDDKIYS